ncbi:hypothetical protein CDAR_46691 [Caerostris darwini]|uniref:Uncharacterized protein n=1 Tax=Caerostris darwini TaxID=1538125 RepID=A0AAV4U5D2_9ARAC|nr:hypothetical protein CDAR_46691 [Caerostris darwini]
MKKINVFALNREAKAVSLQCPRNLSKKMNLYRIETPVAGCIICLVYTGILFMVDSWIHYSWPPSSYFVFTTAACSLSFILAFSFYIYLRYLLHDGDNDTSSLLEMQRRIV